MLSTYTNQKKIDLKTLVFSFESLLHIRCSFEPFYSTLGDSLPDEYKGPDIFALLEEYNYYKSG